MTDARLPGRWLGEMRFMDLSDRAWRVFTGALMWCAEQGTDGEIPARYLRLLHPDGVTDAEIDELISCGVFERTDSGLNMPAWSANSGLGQSTAAAVEGYRERKARNQAAYRQRRRGDSESAHVTGHVGGNVGIGIGSSSSKKAFAYVAGSRAGHVTGHAANIVTVAPGARCADGRHQLVADGTCTRCDIRPGEVA